MRRLSAKAAGGARPLHQAPGDGQPAQYNPRASTPLFPRGGGGQARDPGVCTCVDVDLDGGRDPGVCTCVDVDLDGGGGRARAPHPRLERLVRLGVQRAQVCSVRRRDEATGALGTGMSDFAETDFPLPILMPKQLGLGFNKTNQQLLLSI
jgi:hypothetical protein